MSGTSEGLLEEHRDGNVYSFWFAVKVAVIGSVGGFLFGFDIGVVSGALPLIDDEFVLNNAEEGFLAGAAAIGSVGGAIVGGTICDRLGRISTIYLCCVFYAAGALIIYFAIGFWSICIGRIVVGLGVSLSAIADVSFLTEVSPAQYRGAVVSCNELMITIGFLTAYIVNSEFDSWRIMFLFPAPIAAFWALSIMFVPESPRWYLLVGEVQKAYNSYVCIYGDRVHARSILDSAQEEFSKSTSESTAISYELLHKWKWQLCIVLFLMMAQQMCGNAIILTFMPEITDSYNVNDSIVEEYLSVIYGALKVVATAVALSCIDKYGRRKLLLVGTLSMGIGWLLVTLCYPLDMPVLAEIGAGIVVVAYSISFGCVSWVLVSELFPDVLRSRALGFAMVLNWIWDFVVLFSFLPASQAVGYSGVFIFFILVSFGSFWVTMRFIPETSLLSCFEIDVDIRARFSKSMCNMQPLPNHTYNVDGENDLSGHSSVVGFSTACQGSPVINPTYHHLHGNNDHESIDSITE
jgi:MFS transporter, SP family, galactose:H+ symporter